MDHDIALQQSREPLLKEAWIDQWPPSAHEEVALAGLEIKPTVFLDMEARTLQIFLELRGRYVFRRIYALTKEVSSHEGVVRDAIEEVDDQSSPGPKNATEFTKSLLGV